jgi:ribokinase
MLRGAQALLLQNEVPQDENWRLIARAKQAGCRVIYNNAPAGPIPAAAAAGIGMLVVNEIEAVQSAQSLGLAGDAPETAGAAIASAYGASVIVTIGEQGSMAITPDGTIRVPALPVHAVDTTGAGDTYVGVLAAALAETGDLAAAMRMASAAASLACTKSGTQAAQPSRAEIIAAAARLG